MKSKRITKMLKKNWKNLPIDQKAHYNLESQQDYARYKTELKLLKARETFSDSEED